MNSNSSMNFSLSRIRPNLNGEPQSVYEIVEWKMKVNMTLVLIIFMVFGSAQAQYKPFSWYSRSIPLGKQFVSIDYSAELRHLDVMFYYQTALHDKLEYTGSVLTTNREPLSIGATYSRSDYPLIQTGRVLSSEVKYSTDNLDLRVGRLHPDFGKLTFDTPFANTYISGDGYTLKYSVDNIRFSNRTLMLKNELFDSESYNRYFNFHSLEYSTGKSTITLGEFMIYSGKNREFNWILSNPLVPYIVHNYDYSSEVDDTLATDGDNFMLYSRYGLEYRDIYINTQLYVDEIQIDWKDRSIFTDEYLIVGEIIFDMNTMDKRLPEVIVTIQKSSKGFGSHPGRFLSYSVSEKSLLPNQLFVIQSLSATFVWQLEKSFFYFNLGTMVSTDFGDIPKIYWNRRDLIKHTNELTVNYMDLSYGITLRDNQKILLNLGYLPSGGNYGFTYIFSKAP